MKRNNVRVFKYKMDRWVFMVVVKILIEIILVKLDVGGDRLKNILPVTRHRLTDWEHFDP